MKKLLTLASLLVLASLVLSACGGGASSASDLLGAIKERGYILVSTDPNYAPQSFLSTEARATDTKCPTDALTAVEMDGFDADVAKEIGKRLGVETCFATPDWDMVTAGSWANKWDISVGSMTIKPPRPDTFFFTTPYYAPSGVVGVPADSTLTSVDELAGQSVCVATATTYFDWISGALDLNPEDIYVQSPADIKVVELPTDQECPQAIDAGREDFVAYVTSKTVVDANIAAGMAVKQLGGPLFLEKNAVAFDKASSLDSTSAVETIDNIIKEMHGDGTLSGFSMKWFGTDLTQGLVK